jgi:hypothetical protein
MAVSIRGEGERRVRLARRPAPWGASPVRIRYVDPSMLVRGEPIDLAHPLELRVLSE